MKFQLKLAIFIFRLNLPKKVFSVENIKSGHHHRILHIWISLGTKFQHKLIILSFWTKFTQKRYLQLKTEQAVQGLEAFAFCVVNVNLAVVFKHFEDIEDLIFWTFWKKNWLCLAAWALFILKLYKAFQTALAKKPWLVKVMNKFRYKFQFQIPFQFYRTVEKVETCDGNGQRFWQVPPSFRLSHFGDYFFFMIQFKHTEYKGTLTFTRKDTVQE